MNKQRILIVGSGPSAFGFINGLNENKDIEITLIDNSKVELIDKGCQFKNEFITGNRKVEGLESDNPLISNHFGGFSNFWGGTYDDPNEEIIEKFLDLDIDIKKYLEHIDNLIPRFIFTNNPVKSENTLLFNSILQPKTIEKFRNLGFNVKDSEIATNHSRFNNFNKDKKCEYCGEIESFCREDSIWDTKQFVLNLIEEKKIKYLDDTKLISFEEKKDLVECKLLIKNKINIEKFDKLILATGPVSTAEILLLSKIVNRVIIKTTDLIQVPFIKFFKTSEKLHSFSDLFSSIKVFNSYTYQQHYFFSKTILILSKNAFRLSAALKFMPKFLLSLVGGMFITLDSKVSSKIVMSISENKIKTIHKDGERKKRNKILRYFFMKLLKSKIILFLPIKKVWLRGSSYHNGSQFPLGKFASKETSDSLGRISYLKNTHIVDSSVLPDVNTGPGVKLIIANSYRIASNLYS
tara:strand:+ start:1782 stop:3176 length:1395 start_codon:yes stop_codon:yes gene_type:complete